MASVGHADRSRTQWKCPTVSKLIRIIDDHSRGIGEVVVRCVVEKPTEPHQLILKSSISRDSDRIFAYNQFQSLVLESNLDDISY